MNDPTKSVNAVLLPNWMAPKAVARTAIQNQQYFPPPEKKPTKKTKKKTGRKVLTAKNGRGYRAAEPFIHYGEEAGKRRGVVSCQSPPDPTNLGLSE